MNEHNPITVRLDEMVNVWKNKVQPGHSLIRWMLKPEDHRMYEGFCRLEASPHGKLDNLFVFFYTHFTSVDTFSFDLVENWLREYDDENNRNLMAKAGVQGEWNVQVFRQAVLNRDYAACEKLLPVMIQSYRNWIGQPETPFVLSLLPKQMNSVQQFVQWLDNWMAQERPVNTQLLLFDHNSGNFWGTVFEKFAAEALTLQHDLRMQEAIRQIATAGSAADPYAFFRKCLFEMGAAASQKNQALLYQWGEKAIECGKKTADKTLLSTAYISYAGMLFNFRDHDRINELLDTGIRLCRQGIAAGNDQMKPLLLQYLLYKGADCQVQKDRKEALDWFLKAGDQAVVFELPAQAVSAYYKAFVFAAYKNYHDEKKLACEKALRLTGQLSDEEIMASEYPFVAYEYVQLKQDPDNPLQQAAADKMVALYGEDWPKTVEELKQNYTKKKMRQAEEGQLAVSGS